MSLTDKYRRDGTPYPPGHRGLMEWARDMENMELRRIGFDVLNNGVEVSTVWLGLDHNFGGNNRPLIFESMVFSSERHTSFDQWRYSTEEEARRGHKMLVKKWSTYKTADEVLNSESGNKKEK